MHLKNGLWNAANMRHKQELQQSLFTDSVVVETQNFASLPREEQQQLALVLEDGLLYQVKSVNRLLPQSRDVSSEAE
ncbi:hypothetical protein MKJ04_00780 [Pontibacter sp. E15-1]|uniref:hypothetical protein n=1 Tax=Pontibacter sp. E15-1 TaxID=2919918 RepID=UPI001F4FFF73|nr:hypothetical protein [Pontibacter sp. E15-1]MCJ8163356.1 hypothetical protein [Pontibacter sp. E15-1]